jgi:hypothetical protein
LVCLFQLIGLFLHERGKHHHNTVCPYRQTTFVLGVYHDGMVLSCLHHTLLYADTFISTSISTTWNTSCQQTEVAVRKSQRVLR